MPLLENVPESSDPVHLLLVADTKMGKSTYGAQAVKDGWRMLYIDADNGISAVRNNFADDKTNAMSRLLYYRTEHPCKFIENMLTSGIFRWNLTQDATFSSGTAKDDDKMVEIIPSMIPHNIILNIDSWSAVALDAMEISAADKATTLRAMNESNSEGIYGKAGTQLTLLCAILQHVKFHCIVQAHGTWYERTERPAGKMGDVKRKDMILKEVIKIPISSSRPNGYAMGKYFNQIGWIELDRTDRRNLDFEVHYDRIGGGVPNKKDRLELMSWSQTFGKPPVYETEFMDSSWVREMTVAEWKANRESAAEISAGPSAAGTTLLKTPAQQTVSALMKR